jgi:hypothetical protein
MKQMKVNIQKNLSGGVTYDMLIDFDADQRCRR